MNMNAKFNLQVCQNRRMNGMNRVCWNFAVSFWYWATLRDDLTII